MQTPYDNGKDAWLCVYAGYPETFLEFPSNPYGDEWNNKAAQAFRRGFDDAARADGFTYSDVDGEYHEGGEYQTDEFEQID